AAPAVAAWRRALALRADDAAGALSLLQQVRGTLPYEFDFLRAFVAPILLASGSVEQLVAVGGSWDAAQCAQLYARLAPAAIRELLDTVPQPLGALPPPRDAADCEALWSYADGQEEHRPVFECLGRSDLGLQFVQARIAAIADETDRAARLETLRELLGLDLLTGLPPRDDPWLPLLHTVWLRGVPPSWSTAERQ